MRKVSYLPLWHLLLERGMTKSQMRIEVGLTTNGYQVLRRKKLKAFLESAKNSGKDICVPAKTTVLGVFDFRTF